MLGLPVAATQDRLCNLKFGSTTAGEFSFHNIDWFVHHSLSVAWSLVVAAKDLNLRLCIRLAEQLRSLAVVVPL